MARSWILPTLVCVTLLLPALAGAVIVTANQIGGWRLQKAAAAARSGADNGTPLADALAGCGARCPVDALIDAGAGWGAVAARRTPASRSLALAQGRRALSAALSQRPKSGRAFAELAYLNSLDCSATIGSVIQPLTRSFDYAPFSNTAGLWRAGWAAAHWRLLKMELREHVLDEAAWLRDLPPNRGGRADGGLGSTSAALALTLRGASQAGRPPEPRPSTSADDSAVDHTPACA